MEIKVQNVCLLTVGILAVISTAKGSLTGEEMEIQRPMFDQSLKPTYKLLTGGYSLNPAPSAQAMLMQPTLPVFDNLTLGIIKEAKQGLQYLFQTESPYVSGMAGTGITAFEAALDNMIEPGDTVFIPVNGYWARRAVEASKRLGAMVQTIEKEAGSSFDVEEIKTSIRNILPKVVFIAVADSPSGVTQDIQGIGELCIQLDCYVVADVVSIVGVQPFNFDASKIDVAFCNSQKGIGSITGMAAMAYSPRAIAMAKLRKVPPTIYDRDVTLWVLENYWRMGEDPDKLQGFSYQFPIVEVYALREALRLITEEGIENVWERHQTVHDYFLSKLSSEFPQLKHFVNEKDRSVGTFILKVPDETRVKEILQEMANRFSIHITNGGGSAALDKTLRISIFGPSARKETVDTVFSALKEVLQ